MLDTKLFTKVIRQNKTLLRAGEVTQGLDSINSLWKISVLLRLGYTQRNVVEGFLRSAAVMGMVATNPKAIAHSFANSKRYMGMKRGLKIERKVSKDLEEIRSVLRENELMLLAERKKIGQGKESAETKRIQAEIDKDLELVKATQVELGKAAAETRRINDTRVKGGEQPNVLGDEKYDGAFQGTQGVLARINSSSDKTQRTVFENANQRAMARLEGDPSFREMIPMDLDADGMLDYWEYYTQLINRRYIDDPLAKLILRDADFNAIDRWFKTPEGSRYYEEVFSARYGKSGERVQDDRSAMIQDALDAIETEVPAGSALRKLVIVFR